MRLAVFQCATNGGKPQDYESLHKSAKKGLPVVAINTTAGNWLKLPLPMSSQMRTQG